MIEKVKAFVNAGLTFLGFYGLPETINQITSAYGITLTIFNRIWFITVGIIVSVLVFFNIFFSKTRPGISGVAGILKNIVEAYYVYTIINTFSVIELSSNMRISINFSLLQLLILINLGLWILYNLYITLHRKELAEREKKKKEEIETIKETSIEETDAEKSTANK